MAFLWEFHDVSMIFPWDYYGIPEGSLWDFFVVPMLFPCYFYDLSMGFQFHGQPIRGLVLTVIEPAVRFKYYHPCRFQFHGQPIRGLVLTVIEPAVRFKYYHPCPIGTWLVVFPYRI